MNLKTWQNNFAALLLANETVATWAEDNIKPAGELSVTDALAVYQGNIRGVCINALKQIYPICEKILGEKMFAQVASRFVGLSPSKTPDLNTYGTGFADYLDRLQRDKTIHTDLAYLQELATLEWNMHAIYYVRDDIEFDWQCLQRLSECDPSKVKLRFSRALRLLRMQYPVDKVWRVNQISNAGSISEQQESPYHIALSRLNYETCMHRINANEYALLKYAAENPELYIFSQEAERLEVNSSMVFSAWRENGWLVGVDL